MNRLGTAALAALALALVAGLALSPSNLPTGLGAMLGWFVQAWTQALAIIAVPLVITQVFLAVAAGVGASSSARRLVFVTPMTMAGVLLLAAALSLAATGLLLHLPALDALSLPSPSSPAATQTGFSQPDVTGNWLDDLLPQAIVVRALEGDLLAMLVVTLALALMTRRIGQEGRTLLVRIAEAVSTLAFAAVNALLVGAPLVVFAAMFGALQTSGLEIGTVLVVNAVLKVIVTLTVVAALYAVVAATGTSVGRFARAAVPGQIVALFTRSSLASLPALMAGARDRLGLDANLSGGLLGFAGAALKLSGPVSSTFKFLFLAHVLGIDLAPTQIGAFVLTILATSATTVGIPRFASESSALAFYAAAGMPLEYVVLLSTTTVLTDPFSTLLNSTSYLTFTTVVCRLSGSRDKAPASESAMEAAGPAS